MAEPESILSDPKALAMPREFVLQNGLRIITLSTPTLDTARMGVTVNSGSRDDPPGYEGTAHFLEHMMFQGSFLNRGSLKRSAGVDIMQAFEEWGGHLNATTGKMRTTYGFNKDNYRILNENLDEAAGILLDMLQHPRINEDHVNSERNVIKTEITGKKAIDSLIYSLTCSSLYPHSRLEYAGLGTPESIDRITAAELRQFWRKHYVPSNTTIFIQGKGTDEELLKIVTSKLTVLGANHISPPLVHPPLDASAGEVRRVFPKSDMLSYGFSWETHKKDVSECNKRESLVLSVLLEILSQALYLRLREQERLVYGAGASYDETGAAVFRFDSNQDPQKLTQSFADFMKHYDMHLNQQALDRYKSGLRVKYIKHFENSADVAFGHANRLVAGQKIYRSQDLLKMAQGITLDEIKEMAARVFGKPFGMTIIGNKELMEKVPSKAQMAVAMHLPPNDKPIVGSFPLPDDISPCNIRGQTEQLPKTISSRTR